jgi:hypothetical protein
MPACFVLGAWFQALFESSGWPSRPFYRKRTNMARIELRHCDIVIKDGLAGTAKVNQPMTAPMSGDTTVTIDTVVLNTDNTQQVPVGARFTIAGETAATTVHVVTARTPSPFSTSVATTAIVFTPALSAGTYLDNGILTFAPQELTIKIGDGDLKYTENDDFKYDLDRGNLDTVRQGDEKPMDVSLSFVYEHITTGTGETIAPMDALKRRGGAAEWVSSASDLCEPYAVDLFVVHTPPCGTAQKETTQFPDFRSDKREPSLKDSLIQITGRCNATEPVVSRS